MTMLVRYDAACQAIANCIAIDEAKELHDKAEAMRAYAKQAQNKGLEIDAAEIRMRAERRLGELLASQKATGGLASGGQYGGRPKIDGTRAEPSIQVPTLADVGIDKKLSSRAQRMAAVPQDKFEGMLGEWRGRVTAENERVTTTLLREGEWALRDEKLAKAPTVWPADRYGIIYADPPWRYENPPMGGGNRSVENHYPTMDLAEICALPVSNLAANDSVLFLWATVPKLAECLQVIEAWGFLYRTNMVWIKDKIGMGYYARNRHELLLIAKRGELPVPEPAARPDSVLNAPRTEHSVKPLEYYGLLESMYPAIPKIELFSRSPREGWAAWGNQAADDPSRSQLQR